MSLRRLLGTNMLNDGGAGGGPVLATVEVTGTLTPDITGTFTEDTVEGPLNGQIVYTNSGAGYSIWFQSGPDRWRITTTPGTNSGVRWTAPGGSGVGGLTGSYTPLSGAVGTATVS